MVKALSNHLHRSSMHRFILGRLSLTSIQFLTMMLALTVIFPAQAETQLSATVDRSKIYEMDTLNLTLEGEVDVDFSFGGLMNFGLNQTEKPDTSGLEQNFEILDTQQSYNMQSINGEAKAKVLWRYTLAPKQTGVLEIPSIKFKDAETKTLEITVLAGSAPKNSSAPPAVFLEVETDKTEAYVQEQIIYTLRLYTQGLINGELSEPSLSDAIIEPFGEQKKYYRMAFNQRYEVVERQYLIFPQKSGNLTIAKQEFQGVTIKQGRRTRIRDLSDEIQLSIKAPPKSFSGDIWLPATSLFIKEEWQGDPTDLMVGDSLSRKIVLSSLGLLGSALPPISMNELPNIKLYTDKPQIETVQHESGAQASRIESFAVVALKQGEITLEEIRIPWWDIVNDVERVAVIPATSLNILENPELAVRNENAPFTADPGQALSSNEEQTSTAETSDRANIDVITAGGSQHLWQTIAAILLLAWLVSSVVFYRKIAELKAHLSAVPIPTSAKQLDEKQCYERAIKSIKAEHENLDQQVFNWLECFEGLRSSVYQTLNLQSLKIIDMEVYSQLVAFDASRYAEKTDSAYDSQRLLNALKALRVKLLKTTGSDTKSNKLIKKRVLEPFYQ